MQIILLRHGATDWNVEGRCQGTTDLALNELGTHQAQSIAARLGSEGIRAIYCSDLTRARQTAHLVSLPHALSPMVERGLRELDHGDLEGLTFNDIKERFPQFIKRWRSEPADVQIPGGEKLIDVSLRAWNSLNGIVQCHGAEDTVVVVSHNFPILAIICRITGTDLNQYRTFRIDPCGITRLDHDRNGRWKVTQVNDHIRA